MALQYNICDIDGNIIDENVSIDIINEKLEGDVNIFWDDEGLAERLKEGDEDVSEHLLIKTIEIDEEE